MAGLHVCIFYQTPKTLGKSFQNSMDTDTYLNCLSMIFKQNIKKFPGNLPVSIQRKQIGLLGSYVVSPKIDGERVFLLFNNQSIDLLYRNNSTTSFKSNGTGFNLFDAEIEEKHKIIWIFDSLVIDSCICTNYCYTVRHELIRRFLNDRGSRVIYQSIPTSPSNFSDHVIELQNGYVIRCKHIYHFNDTQTLWFSDRTSRIDGLIFTKLRTKYSPFRTDITSHFKWKPPEYITCDFLVQKKKTTDKRDTIYGVKQKYLTSGDHALYTITASRKHKLFTFTFNNTIHTKIEGIWECLFSQGAWLFCKPRPDKTIPNSVETVVNTIKNIDDIITIQDFAV
jgi:hypothetical protein